MTTRPPAGPAPAPPTWTIHRHTSVVSTNDLAASLPPWHAVVAEQQTGGRGRHGRTWVSDPGGLWLSTVVPTPGAPEPWSLLPLAAGWAVRSALGTLGVRGLHLRWPNDVMSGPAKLAGILVERFHSGTAVIGIGLNCTNTPAVADPDLNGLTVRLADLVTSLPSTDRITTALLDHLGIAHGHLASGGIADLLPTLNEAWAREQVAVTLRPSMEVLIGRLTGVTAEGHLRLLLPDGKEQILPASQVELLREA